MELTASQDYSDQHSCIPHLHMMHSQKDMLFSKCPDNAECVKNRKLGTEFWQLLEVQCVDDKGDPHDSNSRGKK